MTVKTKNAVKNINILPFIAVIAFGFGFLTMFSVNTYSKLLPHSMKKIFNLDKITPKLAGFTQTKTITKEGGSIIVSHKQTVASLNIKKDSLIGSAEISATPISEIKGLSKNTVHIAGLDVKSDNALLSDLATVSFKIPDDYQGKNIAAYSYRGNGTDFHYYPVKIEGNTAVIDISHFSGYGILAVDSFKDNPYEPSDLGDKTVQLILTNIFAGAATQMRQNKQEQMTDDQLSRAANLMRVWFKSGVLPLIDKAKNDPSSILEAGLEYRRWRGYAMLFGLEELLLPEVKEGMVKLLTAIKVNADRASEKCSTNKDAHQAGILIKLADLANKLSSQDIVDFDSTYITKLAIKCARFKLNITSNFVTNTVCGKSTIDAQGEIPLIMDESMMLTGKGQVSLNSYHFCDVLCSQTAPEIHDLEVLDVRFSAYEKPVIVLPLKFVGESPRVTQICHTAEQVNVYDENSVWDGSFINIHLDEYDGNKGFLIKNWEIVNDGGVYARKVYNRSTNWIWPGTENTVFKLIHTPN